MAETSPAAANDADNADTPKNKLVRDSFTIPKAEYAVLNELKQRATRLTQPAKKSELLRAGIALLKGLSDPAFLAALAAVPNLKTGRPRKDGEGEADEAGEKIKRHVKDKTAPKAGANGAAAPASKPERAAARAARQAAKPQKAADKAGKVAARADKPSKPEKQAAKAAKAAAKGRSTT
ncbi:hypothetical protein [Ideonella sp. YS5]|uniref:hypothetical protein n=1 Tax=Ideonella sp. YS5 TaxID=3453714 RepID=UPI003EE86754